MATKSTVVSASTLKKMLKKDLIKKAEKDYNITVKESWTKDDIIAAIQASLKNAPTKAKPMSYGEYCAW